MHSPGRLVAIRGWRVKTSRSPPLLTVSVYRQPGGQQAPCHIPPTLDAPIHADDIEADGVAQLADPPKFNNHNPVPVTCHSHTGFENHVEPRLARTFQLIVLIIGLTENR